jgi:hypothetical protein
MPDIYDIEEHGMDTYDEYVVARVQLSMYDKIQTCRLICCKHELDGSLRGKASAQHILDTSLDTRTYNIEFPDGEHVCTMW